MKIHIVFDLDGTLTDTQKIHQQLEADFLKKKWIFIDPQSIGIRYAGRTPQERIWEVLAEKGIDFTQEEIETFVEGKDNIIISLLEKGEIELMPHTYETLQYLQRKNYRIWLSSGACREFIDRFIRHFGFEDIIFASTSANEVERKKPHPDVFLSSFSQLENFHGTPDGTYVVGDGRSDMEWGHKSWATTVRLNYFKKPKKNDTYCNFEIESLKDLQNIL